MIILKSKIFNSFTSHPSLGEFIGLSLTRLEIQKTEPDDLEITHGHMKSMILKFCDWNAKYNFGDSLRQRLWDVGLLMTGWDLFSVHPYQTDVSPLGIGKIGGACEEQNCALVQFGPEHDDELGMVVDRGYESINTAVHEIGHT